MVFDEQEKEAQRRYDNFDREQLKRAGEDDQLVADDGLKDTSVTPGGVEYKEPTAEEIYEDDNKGEYEEDGKYSSRV